MKIQKNGLVICSVGSRAQFISVRKKSNDCFGYQCHFYFHFSFSLIRNEKHCESNRKENSKITIFIFPVIKRLIKMDKSTNEAFAIKKQKGKCVSAKRFPVFTENKNFFSLRFFFPQTFLFFFLFYFYFSSLRSLRSSFLILFPLTVLSMYPAT